MDINVLKTKSIITILIFILLNNACNNHESKTQEIVNIRGINIIVSEEKLNYIYDVFVDINFESKKVNRKEFIHKYFYFLQSTSILSSHAYSENMNSNQMVAFTITDNNKETYQLKWNLKSDSIDVGGIISE